MTGHSTRHLVIRYTIPFMALIAADRNCRVNCSIAICNKPEAGRETIQSARNHRDRKMKPTEAEFSTDGLPKAFLHSLRTLFDILDDGKKGYVHISEIESRWQGADTQDLPGGVLECLRRVAPPHGYLTFERFVAGLRYSMLNPDNGHLKPRSGVPQRQPHLHSTGQKQGPPQPRQAPGVKSQGCAPGARTVENNVRPLGPSNAVNTQQNRARHEDSNPACQGEWGPTTAPSVTARYSNSGYDRTGRSLERIPVAPESGPHAADSVRNGKQPQQGPSRSKVRSIESLALESPQIHKGSGDEGRGLPRSQSETTAGLAGARRHGRSRGEQRRHTISNGVDYGTLKQMKELEQEKDSLLAGLDVIERAREWYQNQIQNVAEKQRQMGQTNPSTDLFPESGQGRLNLLLPKLQDVNRCLSDLISCSGMPITSHGAPPPAIPLNPQPPPPTAPNAIQRLKDQNRLLTQEVTEKSERITQLEQEKSALIKQLFEARARSAHDNSTLDSTFI
ncbi:suppressor APC domain-containing protein 2-like isoform X1 [Paramormyrops kingsleyae]|uniref:suppressor APC domain-containing protein 2 isoform X1 n=3 Tax=Paramormyrops kingsleyae TaxID=1676925 RepID=UPI003B97AD18